MELDNREIATLFWLALFMVWAVRQPVLRRAIGPLLRTLLTPAIGFPALLAGAYTTGIAFLLHRLGLWQWTDLKETIYWFCGFAVLSFFELPTTSLDPSRFKVVAWELLSLSVIVEFFVNLFVMSLPAELLLTPVIAFLAIALGFSAGKTEHALVNRFFTRVQSLIGVSVFAFVAIQTVQHFNDVASAETLREFALPVLLSVLYFPFAYVMAVFTAYDSLFRRIHWRIKETGVRRYFYRRTLLWCHVNLDRLARWSVASARTVLDSKHAVNLAIADFKALGDGTRRVM